MTSRMTLLVVCSASACKDCTIARPASIIVASWRVKITWSASATRPPLVRPCLPTFSWMDRTSMLRLSRAAMAACSVAASTELRISRLVAVSRATYTKEAIRFSRLNSSMSRLTHGSARFTHRTCNRVFDAAFAAVLVPKWTGGFKKGGWLDPGSSLAVTSAQGARSSGPARGQLCLIPGHLQEPLGLRLLKKVIVI